MKLKISKKLLLLATTSTLALSGCGLDEDIESAYEVNFETVSVEPNYFSNNKIDNDEMLRSIEPYSVINDGLYIKALTTVNVRKQSDVNSEKIGLLGPGASFRYEGEVGDFYKIDYNGNIGYVYKEYADLYVREHVAGPVIDTVYFPEETPVYDNESNQKSVISKNEFGFVYKDDNDLLLVESDGVAGYVNKNQVMSMDGIYAVVDISDQIIRIYNENEVLMESPVVTGNASTTPTKEGLHTIHTVGHNYKLNSPPNYPFVNVMLKFYNNQGLHDAEYYNDPVYGRHGWRATSEFGGSTYLTNGSHGCVNMPHDAAVEADELLQKGDKVLVKR
ncbi:MAG: L,D-transpeptidase family protein [Bacilli bacterium]|nr:L,D-transpeptidase family protein [Bacilli bacterium]